jgi:hypothetical protein
LILRAIAEGDRALQNLEGAILKIVQFGLQKWILTFLERRDLSSVGSAVEFVEFVGAPKKRAKALKCIVSADEGDTVGLYGLPEFYSLSHQEIVFKYIYPGTNTRNIPTPPYPETSLTLASHFLSVHVVDALARWH